MGMQMPIDDRAEEEYSLDEAVDLDDEEPDFDEEDYNQEEDDDGDEIETSDTQSNNRSKIFLFLLLLLLLAVAALAGLHLSGVYQLPILGGDSSQSEIEPSEIETDPETQTDSDSGETPDATPPAPPASDPWREGVNAAISAANLAQTAQTQAEWNTVANEWGRAVELMQQVPESSENYSTAQQKVIEYGNNQQIALQRAQNAPN